MQSSSLHMSLQPPCVTLKLSLQNLQYANDGPLLLAVIPGHKVQEDKHLAGFLFAGGSNMFFHTNAFFRNNTVKYGRLAALFPHTQRYCQCHIGLVTRHVASGRYDGKEAPSLLLEKELKNNSKGRNRTKLAGSCLTEAIYFIVYFTV